MRSPRSRHALDRDARLARRHFLAGGGALVALPWLESLSSVARAAPRPPGGVDAPQRLIFWFVPNGMPMDQWTPSQTGAGFALPRILEPLADRRADALILSGLSNAAAEDSIEGDHARGTGSFLTCAPCNPSETEIYNGPSVDQIAAQAIAGQTNLASLQLGIEGGDSVGDCDSGYSCAYTRNISWSSATTPLPQLTNPSLVFDRIFGGYDPQASEAERQRTSARRLSVLDHVVDQINALDPKLSARDQEKLDEYLTGVRELEVRIETGGALACDVPDRPASSYDHPDHVSIVIDLMVLALECDATRVISFMQGNGASSRSHDFLGVPDAFHDLSHHGDDPDALEGLATIGTWEVQQLAALMDRMAETEDGYGSLLDNSAILFSSEIADGNTHDHRDLPVILAGHAGGLLSSGRHLRFDDQPIADLYLTLLQIFGADAASFGQDGSSVLDELFG